MDEHAQHHNGSDGASRWVFRGFLLIAGFYLITEHRAHLYGIVPYLLLLACPLMHYEFDTSVPAAMATSTFITQLSWARFNSSRAPRRQYVFCNIPPAEMFWKFASSARHAARTIAYPCGHAQGQLVNCIDRGTRTVIARTAQGDGFNRPMTPAIPALRKHTA